MLLTCFERSFWAYYSESSYHPSVKVITKTWKKDKKNKKSHRDDDLWYMKTEARKAWHGNTVILKAISFSPFWNYLLDLAYSLCT